MLDFKKGRKVRIYTYICIKKSWKNTQNLKSGFLWEGDGGIENLVERKEKIGWK